MQRIALTLAYDGARFDGWQTQPSGRTVQDALEASIAALAGHPVRVACAGRTDAGVHAAAQVVHFDTSAQRPLHAWVRGVNARLPDAVAVLDARVAPEGFHARYSALRRHYVYLLHCAPVAHPLLAGRAGWVFRPLDVAAMRSAAACLLGEHDFSAFRAAQCQAKSPVRTLERLAVTRLADLVVLEFSANAFLHHMVRNIVGALVTVGTGRQSPEWIAQLLASRDRRQGPATFSAAGLYLAGVDYDGEIGMHVGRASGLGGVAALVGSLAMPGVSPSRPIDAGDSP
ncbi:MAG: tRNA pseudouridine(38-40) synthase TruA [Burkholderiaceae bacterium]|nr:tRNA pseudouridine(38-40) synthase TruA [Burkholderiaceae bacterium]MEB2318521.1 tRNA pseudouridine(38-40) synthase TruA [Pseudomonadota bacterium]